MIGGTFGIANKRCVKDEAVNALSNFPPDMQGLLTSLISVVLVQRGT